MTRIPTGFSFPCSNSTDFIEWMAEMRSFPEAHPILLTPQELTFRPSGGSNKAIPGGSRLPFI